MASRKIRSASMPVPHASSGFSGDQAGIEGVLQLARVSSEIAANGTPRSCARSTKSARSPPESWMLAIPRPVVDAPRGGEQLHRVRQLVEGPDLLHAVGVEHAPRRRRARRPAHPSARSTIALADSVRPDLQRHDRDARSRRRARAARGTPPDRAPSPATGPARASTAGASAYSMYSVHRGDDLLAAGDHEVEPDPAVVERERRERRARCAR